MDMIFAWGTLAVVVLGLLILWLAMRGQKKARDLAEQREWDSQEADDRIVERQRREGGL